MALNERNWSNRFIAYMEKIVSHPNYEGLPIERKADGSLKWVATKQSKIGQARLEWADKKIAQLGIEKRAGQYAELMLKIHPTKRKVCQICGKEMSLYYVYPNAKFLESLNKTFNSHFTDCDNINYIWDELINNGESFENIATFFIQKFKLSPNYKASSKYEIIQAMEFSCRKGGKKYLGPGAMSNFPDRYDGFHTYNRCCRSTEDSGRSKENLKSYTKDRRAYEYWSDGNIHAANQFMGSSFFSGISADHIGPISLGFIHDPRYLQPMKSNNNSAKRDRLQVKDIELIIETENRTGIYPMSWQSSLIWEFIKKHYLQNLEKVETVYRDALKQNMVNYMYILFFIIENSPNNGRRFLINAFLKPHFDCFNYSYTFNKDGTILNKSTRHYTERNRYELDRYVRIAFESIYDYNRKNNRNNKPDLTITEINILKQLCYTIEHSNDLEFLKKSMQKFIISIENRIIHTIEKGE